MRFDRMVIGVATLALGICLPPLEHEVAASTRSDQPARPLTLEQALTILEVAERTAVMLNICVGIGVVDARADVIAAHRMTCGGSIPGGIGKAVTAALFRQPSGEVSQFATTPVTRDLNEMTGRRMNFLQGGVPIFRGGVLIGAVGVSGGGTSQYDEEIAVAGIGAIF